MFRKIWAWFHVWTGTAKATSYLAALEHRCRLAEAENERAVAAFAESLLKLQALRDSFESQSTFVEERIAAIQRTNKRSEETINELRAELRVANDVTIPSLVAAHKLILTRYDAEVAIAVRRSVSGMPRVEE